MNNLVIQLSDEGILLDYRGCIENSFIILSKESIGKSVYDIFTPDIAPSITASVNEALKTGEPQSFDWQPPWIRESYYQLTFMVSRDNVLLLIKDISEYKQAAEKASYLAYHDGLTGLPNRYLFNDRVKQALAHAQRDNHLAAILFIDVDNFKQINDTMGHHAGDQLLEGLAKRLTVYLRQTDSVIRVSPGHIDQIIARVGGDEFVVLLTRICDKQSVTVAVRRILDLLSSPFNIDAQNVFVTVSVGIAIFPSDGKNIETLLVNADAAMYHAKERGKNNYQYYSESMNKFALERFVVENKLRRGLDQKEFMLFYQPQVDISTGKMTGVEALIRWLQPDLVLVKPGQFIPLAEETGLILPIGEWVLHTACRENRAWQMAGLPPMHTTVNVSAIQFKQDNFVETVSRILKETQLNPRFLQLELTETTIMQHSQSTIEKLQALQAMGVQIAIDDFGTGYSSLNYLKRFPLSTLKIDYSFVKELDTSINDQILVGAIVNLAHSFNLKVVAEGLERREQLAFLHSCGCEEVQGYLICPPVSSELLIEFVKKKKHLDVLKMCP